MTKPACRFTLPIPPSANNLFVNRAGGGRARSAKYEAWIRDAGWAIKTSSGRPPNPMMCRVRILIEMPLGRHRDLDNTLKPILDILGCKKDSGMRIILDDRWIDDIHVVRRWSEREDDRCVVSIWPMESGT